MEKSLYNCVWLENYCFAYYFWTGRIILEYVGKKKEQYTETDQVILNRILITQTHFLYGPYFVFKWELYRLYVMVVVGATIWTVRKEITVQFIPQTWNLIIVKSSKQQLLLN